MDWEFCALFMYNPAWVLWLLGTFVCSDSPRFRLAIGFLFKALAKSSAKGWRPLFSLFGCLTSCGSPGRGLFAPAATFALGSQWGEVDEFVMKVELVCGGGGGGSSAISPCSRSSSKRLAANGWRSWTGSTCRLRRSTKRFRLRSLQR